MQKNLSMNMKKKDKFSVTISKTAKKPSCGKWFPKKQMAV